jgi:uncharacterized protein YprB with RNaseH-like and TPR domain
MSHAFLTKTEATSTYTLPLTIGKGSVIDFETTGVPGRDANHEIITLGYLCRDKLTVIQRNSPDKTPYYTRLSETFNSIPRPFYAYNSSFERDVIRLELGIEILDQDFVDLMAPWKQKAMENGLKWPRLDELISEPEDYFQRDKVTGREVPLLWKQFLEDQRSERPLEMIVKHCASDVLREATLLLRYQ